jgi:RNA polymerase-binding transcription factor
MTDTTTRNADLRQMLSRRRREIEGDVQTRIRDGRNGRLQEGRDNLEDSEADIQGDIEFALLQMRFETLTRIDEALARLDEGHYGFCRACAGEIAEPRLRALPFAVRCQACEEAREQRERNSGRGDQQRNGLPLFAPGI